MSDVKLAGKHYESSVRRACPKRPRACRKFPTSTSSKSRRPPPRPTSRSRWRQLFAVKVEAVNVLNVKGKDKAFKNRKGRRVDWRKAYVTLAEGQSIDVMAKA